MLYNNGPCSSASFVRRSTRKRWKSSRLANDCLRIFKFVAACLFVSFATNVLCVCAFRFLVLFSDAMRSTSLVWSSMLAPDSYVIRVNAWGEVALDFPSSHRHPFQQPSHLSRCSDNFGSSFSFRLPLHPLSRVLVAKRKRRHGFELNA